MTEAKQLEKRKRVDRRHRLVEHRVKQLLLIVDALRLEHEILDLELEMEMEKDD